MLKSILCRILWGILSVPIYIILYPSIREERRLIKGVKSRIERVNIERRKRGEPELIVVGDTYPPSIITADELT